MAPRPSSLGTGLIWMLPCNVDEIRIGVDKSTETNFLQWNFLIWYQQITPSCEIGQWKHYIVRIIEPRCDIRNKNLNFLRSETSSMFFLASKRLSHSDSSQFIMFRYICDMQWMLKWFACKRVENLLRYKRIISLGYVIYLSMYSYRLTPSRKTTHWYTGKPRIKSSKGVTSSKSTMGRLPESKVLTTGDPSYSSSSKSEHECRRNCPMKFCSLK